MKDLIITNIESSDVYDIPASGPNFINRKNIAGYNIKFQYQTLSFFSSFERVIFDYQRFHFPLFFHHSTIKNSVFRDNIRGQMNLNCSEFETCLFSNIGNGIILGNFVEACSFHDCTFSCVVFEVFNFTRNKFKNCVFIDCTFPENSFLNLFQNKCTFIRCTFPKNCLSACAVDNDGVEMYECSFDGEDTTNNIKDVIKEGMPELDLVNLRNPNNYLEIKKR